MLKHHQISPMLIFFLKWYSYSGTYFTASFPTNFENWALNEVIRLNMVGKLTPLDMTLMGWQGHKTSAQKEEQKQTHT